MNEHSITAQPVTPLPADNLARSLKIARPDLENCECRSENVERTGITSTFENRPSNFV